jgi:TIR domain
MTTPVTDDARINTAAKAIGQSSQRRAVFREIHSSKKRIKTVGEIAEATALPRKRVLEEAVKLVHKGIITKTKRDGDTAYERDNFYYAHRKEIFRRADAERRAGTRVRVSAPQPVRRIVRRVVRRRATPRKAGAPQYDLFLSHASEDKKAIASPLCRALTKAGLSVWYDQRVLTLGDSLRRTIDQGLAHSRFGIVILSPKFFAKDWPQRELDGLVARENASGEKAIIPIWHKLTKTQVANYSPTLADRLAGKSSEGVRALTRQIKEVLAASPPHRR